jgi:hypothetical protein
MSKTKRRLTWVAWAALITTRGLALVAPAAGAVTVLYFLSLAGLAWLLIVYNRRLAQWRVVAGIWLAYCAARWLVTRLPLLSVPFLSRNVTGLIVLLVMDTLLAGFASLVILAIRRDVSVAYIALASYGAGLALFSQVRLAGGVLNWLLGAAATEMFDGFTLAEPLIMAGACMFTLGIFTFIPHLVCLLVREARGR